MKERVQLQQNQLNSAIATVEAEPNTKTKFNCSSRLPVKLDEFSANNETELFVSCFGRLEEYLSQSTATAAATITAVVSDQKIDRHYSDV